MSDSELKVTDKRMFTPEGELREEYRRFAGDGEAAESERAEEGRSAEASEDREPREPEPKESEAKAAGSEPEAAAPRPAPAAEPVQGRGAEAEPEPTDSGPRLEIPTSPGPGGSGAGFLDLLATLVQPAAVYLGDVELPDGSTAEDLELARLYIDLLEVLREKTRGNLDAREHTALEEALYQLRMRYVHERDG